MLSVLFLANFRDFTLQKNKLATLIFRMYYFTLFKFLLSREAMLKHLLHGSNVFKKNIALAELRKEISKILLCQVKPPCLL
jgi:hypothetical protein